MSSYPWCHSALMTSCRRAPILTLILQMRKLMFMNEKGLVPSHLAEPGVRPSSVLVLSPTPHSHNLDLGLRWAQWPLGLPRQL